MAKRLFIVLLLMLSAAGFSYSADYLIGPGDVIEISVYDNDDLRTRVRVGDDGSIIMPLLGGWLALSYGYQIMFTTTFVLCLIGLAMLRFWVKEPRKINNPSV